MPLEITGKLIQVLPEQTGAGKNGNWVKQDFIIETAAEQYPKKICFSAWGDKMQILKTLNAGTQVNVAFDIESREFNGKWYTNLKAWKIAPAGSAASAPDNNREPVEFSQSYNDLGAAADMGAKDDLPF
jgi:hypothetical protein